MQLGCCDCAPCAAGVEVRVTVLGTQSSSIRAIYEAGIDQSPVYPLTPLLVTGFALSITLPLQVIGAIFATQASTASNILTICSADG